jgi:hypothetical protein
LLPVAVIVPRIAVVVLHRCTNRHRRCAARRPADPFRRCFVRRRRRSACRRSAPCRHHAAHHRRRGVSSCHPLPPLQSQGAHRQS